MEKNIGHLAIGRKENESFWVGDDVRITLLKIDRNKVRLLIEAPEDVVVLREELKNKIAAGNAAAAG